MNFSKRKLPISEAQTLQRVPIAEVKLHLPLEAPAYVLFRTNQKFVSVKGPLAFFTSKDIAQLGPFGEIYFPKCVEHFDTFRTAGRFMRAVFSWEPKAAASRSDDKFPPVIPP